MEEIQERYFDPDDDDYNEDGEDIVIPSGPTKVMNKVIRCSTGARVQQLLNHLLTNRHNCIVNIQIGMCTCMNNGLLMSQPSPNEDTNVLLFFTPPIDIDEGLSTENQARLKEQ